MKSRLLPLLSLFALLLLPAGAAEKLKVVSFSTVLTEIAERVGGDRVEVIGLIKPGEDPHAFQLKPEHLKLVSDSDLILLSAKHMESYVTKLKESTGTKATMVEVGDRFPSLRMKRDEDHDHDHDHAEKEKASAKGHDHKHGDEETVEDPHWWHSTQNMRRATKVVQDELSKLAPDAAAVFADRAAAYTKALGELDRWAKVEVSKIPRNQRKLVTTHDAFQYFAKDYGFTVYPIEGISSEDQPSSRAVAELIALIRKEGVKAVFLENTANPKVSTEVTKESGAKIGGTLYPDGLVDGDGDTYDKMFRHNVSTIVQGLTGTK